MKKLIFVRHAKSDWGDPFSPDHKRPLSLRGLRDAPFMAQKLKKKNISLDLILSSDAKRAEATALITAENLHFPKSQIKFSPNLYHASSHTLLLEIKKIQDEHETVFLIGHNPGLNDIIELLGGDLDNLPTCGQFGFTFKSESWSEIRPENAEVWFFDYPKNKT